MCSDSHYCTLAEYIICALPLQAVTSQSSWKPLSGSNDIIRIGALVAWWRPRIHPRCSRAGLWLCGCCPCPIHPRGIPAQGGSAQLTPLHALPMASLAALPSPTTEKQSRLFRSVIFCLRQGATQTDKLQIKRVPHSTPALAVNSPVVQFPALRACQFQLIAGGTKTLCPDSPGSRHP